MDNKNILKLIYADIKFIKGSDIGICKTGETYSVIDINIGEVIKNYKGDTVRQSQEWVWFSLHNYCTLFNAKTLKEYIFNGKIIYNNRYGLKIWYCTSDESCVIHTPSGTYQFKGIESYTYDDDLKIVRFTKDFDDINIDSSGKLLSLEDLLNRYSQFYGGFIEVWCIDRSFTTEYIAIDKYRSVTFYDESGRSEYKQIHDVKEHKFIEYLDNYPNKRKLDIINGEIKL